MRKTKTVKYSSPKNLLLRRGKACPRCRSPDRWNRRGVRPGGSSLWHRTGSTPDIRPGQWTNASPAPQSTTKTQTPPHEACFMPPAQYPARPLRLPSPS